MVILKNRMLLSPVRNSMPVVYNRWHYAIRSSQKHMSISSVKASNRKQ